LFVSTTLLNSCAEAGDKPVIKVLKKSHLAADPSVDVWIREHWYQPGWTAPTHSHNSDLFIYVVEGSFEVTTKEDGRVVYGSGEAVLMRPNLVMEAGNASDSEPLKLSVVQVGAVDEQFVVPVE
jgi:quercetin dioxygenase-like cupin family protein